MKTEFLNRLDKIEVPAEFQDIIESIKPILSCDSDLNHEYSFDDLKLGFTRVGESATLQICEDWDDFEYPILVAGF